MKTVSVPTAFLIVIILAGLSMAWAQHDHHNAGGHSSTSNDQDKREFVRFPDALREHTLSNMRDHLLALQEIQLHLGLGHNDIAAKIAESRLGMSSLSLHGAAEVAKYMPQGMQDAGTAMHHCCQSACDCSPRCSRYRRSEASVYRDGGPHSSVRWVSRRVPSAITKRRSSVFR